MIVRCKFESDVAGSDVFSIDTLSDLKRLSGEIQNCDAHLIVKIPDKQIETINLLLDHGFRYSCLTLYLKSQLDDEKPADLIHRFRPLSAKDLKALHQICDGAFSSHNRYANDPFLTQFNPVIHRKWIENSIEGYADYCCGYEDNGGQVTALATLHYHDEYASIGLLAVDPHCQKRGIGQHMMDHLKAVTIQNGLKRLHVATEAGNNPALNLYAANGFKFYDASISLYRLEKTW